MLWFTIWFLVILKIPILYLAYVIWWAVKDPPQPGGGPGTEGFGEPGGGPSSGQGPSARRVPVRGRGPHGSPARRPARTFARERARVSR